jgi:hypothetical protein
VNTAASALPFRSDSTVLKPLLARERARNQTEARLRLRARLAARRHTRDTVTHVLTAATHVRANTFSFNFRG